MIVFTSKIIIKIIYFCEKLKLIIFFLINYKQYGILLQGSDFMGSPSLKDAKKRTNKVVKIRNYIKNNELANIGINKKYYM